jgi:hypothetical protein
LALLTGWRKKTREAQGCRIIRLCGDGGAAIVFYNIIDSETIKAFHAMPLRPEILKQIEP